MIPTPICGIVRCIQIEYRILLQNSLYMTNSLILEFLGRILVGGGNGLTIREMH